jgi:hypothetical protein
MNKKFDSFVRHSRPHFFWRDAEVGEQIFQRELFASFAPQMSSGFVDGVATHPLSWQPDSEVTGQRSAENRYRRLARKALFGATGCTICDGAVTDRCLVYEESSPITSRRFDIEIRWDVSNETLLPQAKALVATLASSPVVGGAASHTGDLANDVTAATEGILPKRGSTIGVTNDDQTVFGGLLVRGATADGGYLADVLLCGSTEVPSHLWTYFQWTEGTNGCSEACRLATVTKIRGRRR